MHTVKNKKVLIIGGSGLIGKRTSLDLIKNGAIVVNIDLVDNVKKKKKL